MDSADGTEVGSVCCAADSALSVCKVGAVAVGPEKAKDRSVVGKVKASS